MGRASRPTTAKHILVGLADSTATYLRDHFRKSLEESRQVLYHDFANEFKAEVDRHLRAFAKGKLPPANAPGMNVLSPLEVLAEMQKQKIEKD